MYWAILDNDLTFVCCIYWFKITGRGYNQGVYLNNGCMLLENVNKSSPHVSWRPVNATDSYVGLEIFLASFRSVSLKNSLFHLEIYEN